MIKSQCFINTAKNETYVFKRFKRKQNSDYEYESFPDITFRGKIANTPETKNYRLQKGICDDYADTKYKDGMKVNQTKIRPEKEKSSKKIVIKINGITIDC